MRPFSKPTLHRPCHRDAARLTVFHIATKCSRTCRTWTHLYPGSTWCPCARNLGSSRFSTAHRRRCRPAARRRARNPLPAPLPVSGPGSFPCCCSSCPVLLLAWASPTGEPASCLTITLTQEQPVSSHLSLPLDCNRAKKSPGPGFRRSRDGRRAGCVYNSESDQGGPPRRKEMP